MVEIFTTFKSLFCNVRISPFIKLAIWQSVTWCLFTAVWTELYRREITSSVQPDGRGLCWISRYGCHGSLSQWNEATAAQILLNPNGCVPFTLLTDLNKNWKPSPHYEHKEPVIHRAGRSWGTSAGRIRSLGWKVSVLSVLWCNVESETFDQSSRPYCKYFLRCTGFHWMKQWSIYFAQEPLKGPICQKQLWVLTLRYQTKRKRDINNDIKFNFAVD